MLIIRADASAEIGTGHVMRCLALAQAWQAAGGSVVFASYRCPGALAERLGLEGATTEEITAAPGTEADAAQTVALAKWLGAAWVVVDGYAFGVAYQEALRKAGLRVLFIDDYGHAEYYTADLVLNQNVYATAALYPNREVRTRLLLGTRYALLRKEFGPWQGWRRPVSEQARRVLITLGGSDQKNVTGRILEGVQQLNNSDIEVQVLVGASNLSAASICAQAQADLRVRVRQSVSNMPKLMAWADVGVTAGGSTCYEAALLGLPCLVTILANNQRAVAVALAAKGTVGLLGWHENLTAETAAAALQSLLASPGRRASMARAGQRLVPGSGAEHVAREMRFSSGIHD